MCALTALMAAAPCRSYIIHILFFIHWSPVPCDMGQAIFLVRLSVELSAEVIIQRMFFFYERMAFCLLDDPAL